MGKLKAYFTKYMQIALKNDAIDFYRLNKVDKNIRESYSYDSVEVSVSLNGEIGTSFFDVDKSIIRNLDLRMAIEKLNQEERKIILLYLDSCTSKEIAKIMSISITNATTKINRIKKKIKKLMEGK